MVNILCYGDSNTNGSMPDGGRWPLHVRWPSVLQDILGEGYHIIEEGCGGRTTVLEDWLEPDINGRNFLPVCLRTHRPLDLVIIMLGTNDMKKRFSLLPVDIAYGAAELGKLVESFDNGPKFPIPKVLLVSPIHIKEGIENSPFTGFAPEAAAISRQLAPYYEAQAKAHGWLYFDAATVAVASDEDKLHMQADSHKALAEALAALIREHF